MGAPVLGWAVVLVKTRAKMVVAMIMAMPTGRATMPHCNTPGVSHKLSSGFGLK